MIPTPLRKLSGCKAAKKGFLGKLVDTPTRCKRTTKRRDDRDLIYVKVFSFFEKCCCSGVKYEVFIVADS